MHTSSKRLFDEYRVRTGMQRVSFSKYFANQRDSHGYFTSYEGTDPERVRISLNDNKSFQLSRNVHCRRIREILQVPT